MKTITKFSEKRRITWFVTGLLFVFMGCQDRHIDPRNPILGKWVWIQSGENRVRSTQYEEYLPDSVLKHFDMNEGSYFSEETYWINDSLLYRGYFSNGRFTGFAFKYQFLDKKSKLRLVHYPPESSAISIAPMSTLVYQRVK